MDRRGFLGAVVGAVGLGVYNTSSGVFAAEAGAGPIIDTHQHVWNLKRFRLPWLDRAGERLNRSYGVADYAKAVEGLDVTKAVYVEVAVTPEQREAEADYVVDLCRSKAGPTAIGVIGGDPGAAGFRAYIGRFKGSPYVKGVRAGFPRGGVEDRAFVEGVRLLGELGMSFDLLVGNDRVGEGAKLVEACPGTRFVLDHCGNPDVKWYSKGKVTMEARRRWEEGVARLAERANVVCKISGVAESGEDGRVTAEVVAPVVNYCLDRFGEERVMFASNWPVCLKTISLAGWVGVLREAVRGRGAAFGRRLFYQNAARFFGL